MDLNMNRIGSRLRKERERLGLSQQAFGRVGGVETNAQGKYESGERFPKSDYFAAIAAIKVDLLFILTGTQTPHRSESLSAAEEKVLACFRVLTPEDQDAVSRLTTTIAEFVSIQPGARSRISE